VTTPTTPRKRRPCTSSRTPGSPLRPSSDALGHRLRAWADSRCSHARDWSAPALVEAKKACGADVAVVLPALNEESTVGAIVSTIRTDLVDGARTDGLTLVDDLVVVDSGSTDATVERAADAGARVVRRSDVLGEVPPLPGKGEVLWRGVAATSADVVVFVDSDLEDFTSDFVVGLLGPLLTCDDVSLVKATYDRPLAQGETVLPAGGGRVTELVARPLLNMFWPELAGFVQPLSGEYAARRSLLERVQFPTGYGVELGMLVEAWQLVGLDGLAQVDLVRRKHRNSDDAKLGAMASEIIQVALDRLTAQQRMSLQTPIGTSMLQFTRQGEDYRSHVVDVAVRQRPPLLSLPAYAEHVQRADSSS
jgi:glucosyl-3-phosphoglycerate synthase